MQSEGEAMALFKSSDLQSNRRAVLDAAARDRAIISDRDGQLVMLPEKRLGNLEKYQNWSLKLARLRSLEKRSDATVAEWGDLAWLKAFDAEDLDAFCDELYDLLITCAAMDDFDALDESIREWKTTAGQLEDPLRRRVLLSDGFDDEDFVAASAPSDERKAD